MERPFNWGIIGTGRIAHKFAKDIGTINGACVYVVASRSLDKAQHFAKAYDAPYAVGNYANIMAIENLDAVYIATPHVLHAANTIMCLESRIPVLCEKPFAMNAAEVRKMLAASKTHNTFLMEALWTRFMPPVNKALELIEAGVIGELNSVKADFGFKADYNPEGRLFNPALGGGSLLDIGIYPLFLSLLIFGKPEQINASAIIGDTGVDEVCGMVLKFSNNKLALLHSTILSQTNTETFIYGSKGYIHMHTRWHELTSLSVHLDGVEQAEYFEFEKKCTGYCYEAMEVMRCVRSGQRESEKMSHEFSLLLIETLDAIRAKCRIEYPIDNL